MLLPGRNLGRLWLYLLYLWVSSNPWIGRIRSLEDTVSGFVHVATLEHASHVYRFRGAAYLTCGWYV